MKMYACSGWQGEEELKSESPTESQISELLYSLTWDDFNSIRLEIDDNNWLDASGNIREDGLAIVYAERGVHYFSKEAPEDLKVLEDILKLYLVGDKRFTNIGFTSEFEEYRPDMEPVLKSVTEADYQKWKFEYEAKQQEENWRKEIKKIILSLVAIMVALAVYKLIEYAYQYDYEFSGHETAVAIADVTEVDGMYYREEYIQRVTYFFTAAGKRHKGYFLGPLTDSLKRGDQVKVKYAIDDPSISEIVELIETTNHDAK